MPKLPQEHVFSRSVWAYPLVGLVMGAALAGVGAVLIDLGLHISIVAGLMLSLSVLSTGALHEDGLADTADGLWGGHTVQRRLDIMKDRRIGAYGVLALILAMGLRWLGYAEVTWAALITALMVSRAVMPVLMLGLPNARDHGLARSVGAPAPFYVSLGIGISAIMSILLVGHVAALLAFGLAGVVLSGVGALARAKIGGQTGDILGAVQVLTEIALLVMFTIFK